MDVGFLSKLVARSAGQSTAHHPFRLVLNKDDSGDVVSYVPKHLEDSCNDDIVDADAADDSTTPSSLVTVPQHLWTQPGVAYWHTRVVRNDNQRSNSNNNDKDNKNNNNSLSVHLDLPPRPAHLVLGLNNHHVGSYYWARSAGAGSAMEAPGIVQQPSSSDYDDQHSILTWTTRDCQSNDGKRSEWVAFLQPPDTVQLVPDSISSWLLDHDLPLWGISSHQRPLGSEPAVVGAWVPGQ